VVGTLITAITPGSCGGMYKMGKQKKLIVMAFECGIGFQD
jgi:hypothetical protein